MKLIWLSAFALVALCLPASSSSAQAATSVSGWVPAASSMDEVFAYVKNAYFAGIDLNEAQEKRMQQIILATIEEQKKQYSRLRPAALDSMRNAEMIKRNDALRTILTNPADRARFDANRKKAGR